MTTYFTPSVFAAMRNEIGTLGSIQQFFHNKDIEDEPGLELLFSIADLHTLREMEAMDDVTLYFIIDGLIEGFKDGKAIVEEMSVPQ